MPMNLARQSLCWRLILGEEHVLVQSDKLADLGDRIDDGLRSARCLSWKRDKDDAGSSFHGDTG